MNLEPARTTAGHSWGAVVVVAIVWVLSSWWLTISWAYASASAITCGSGRMPAAALSTGLAALALAVMGVLCIARLATRAKRGQPTQLVLVDVGLAVTIAAGVVAAFFTLVLIASAQADGAAPITISGAVATLFVLGLYFVPAIAGLVGVAIGPSTGNLSSVGHDVRASVATLVSAGVPLLWLALTYLAVSGNCSDFGWML